MLDPRPRYTKEEFARRGETIYDQSIRAHAEATSAGKFVAIDIETGAFEIDTDDFSATERLVARNPDAQIWLMRVGHSSAYRIGRVPSTTRGRCLPPSSVNSTR